MNHPGVPITLQHCVDLEFAGVIILLRYVVSKVHGSDCAHPPRRFGFEYSRFVWNL